MLALAVLALGCGKSETVEPAAPSQLEPEQPAPPDAGSDARKPLSIIDPSGPDLTWPDVAPVPPVGPVENLPRRAMYIVAHQDDDLTIMNPDMTNEIKAGSFVQTVFLTSGDAGFKCAAYTQGRETGIRAAYAQIAGVPDVWEVSEHEVAGKLVRLATLRDTRISLLFVGLHNSGLFDNVVPDLEKLWNGSVETVETRPFDGRSRADRYTRTELIELLRQLMLAFDASQVSTLDSSKLQPLVFPFDHSDHVHSALFALAALQRYEPALQVGMYRAYNTLFEQENVSTADATLKLAAFRTYASHDAKICATGVTTICDQQVPCDDPTLYNGYEKRQYRVIVYQNVRGVLRGPGGTCMEADLTTRRALAKPCNSANLLQQWKVSTDRTIRHRGTDLCLSSTPGTRTSPVTLRECDGNFDQRFLLTAQTQLRGPDASCVQADGEQLTLQECGLDARQMDWNPQAYPNLLTALIDGLSDLPNALSYYGTLVFADVDGDRDGDVCVRRADGIYCAFSQATQFFDYGLKLAQFRDADGWFLARYGSTVQLGDLDGDGRADVCGRGREGVYCAVFSAADNAFVDFRLRSDGDDFSDSRGYAAGASYYRSLRLADVNGDKRADLCGRRSDGIECALSRGDGTFARATSWTQDDFTDALGWRADSWGSTLHYGDIDGDGRLDVCGRSAAGIRCARNDGRGHFVDGHVWSFTGDFSDDKGWGTALSSYGSIQLVDIDADGRSDVCGRSTTGIVCGLSTGSEFSVARPLVSATSYDDRDGWSLDRYGSTLGFLDLDLDGTPDWCAWGPQPGGTVGLNCALSE